MFINKVRKWLWLIFPPFETSLLILEVNAFFKKNDKNPLNFGSDIVQKTVIKMIKKNPEMVVYSLRIERKKVDELALTLIGIVAGQLLGSGNYHVYRGLLSMSGSSIRGIYSSVFEELHVKGFITDKELQNTRENIQRDIQAVG